VAAPIVSVVMPTFNRVEYLQAAIESVHAQTFRDWELIVVDDGSDEQTLNFLRSRSDPRTTLLFGAHTGNPAAVRNQGLEIARGRYAAFLDSDDGWRKDKLERQVALLESAPARRWSYTAVRRIDGAGGVIARSGMPWAAYSGAILEQVLRIDAQIATPAVMAELAFIRELGCFDERLRFSEDYDMWARMALRSDVSVDPEPTADVRSHAEHFTFDRAGKLEGWATFYAKMEGLVPTPDLRALCRRQRREYVLLLAAEQARGRDWAGMRHSLRAAVESRAWSPRGWLRVAKAAAQSTTETLVTDRSYIGRRA
jgi:glycosyltransferase involved in cell wall biosynthesis